MNTKQIFTLIFALCCLINLTLIAQAQQKVQTNTQQFKLDLTKSKILWKAPKNHGGSSHFGFILFNSGNMIAESSGQPTSATFVINMNSISSTDRAEQKENLKLDLQLKSADFFDVARFQTAVMIVKKIAPTKVPSVFAITGDLTMKGVTNTIYFNATIKRNANQIRITANFQIDRLKWNVKNMDGNFFGEVKNMFIEEQVPITLDLLFTKM